MKEFDSDALGNSEKVNSYCGKAIEFCERTMVDPYNNYTNVSFASIPTILLGLKV